MTKPVSKKMMKNRMRYVQIPYSWITANHILVDMKKKGYQRINHKFWKIMGSVSILT